MIRSRSNSPLFADENDCSTRPHYGMNKETIIINFLEAHGPQSLKSLKEGFKVEKLRLPFGEISDQEYHAWLRSIEMVKYRKTGRTTEYYVKEFDWGIRRRSIASPQEHRSPLKELQDPVFEVNGPTSTAIKRVDVIHRKTNAPIGHQQHATPSTSRPIPGTSRPILSSSPIEKESEVPNMYDIVMVGDHTFLNLAVFDLKFAVDTSQRPRQSGHCVSGLKIADATKRIQAMDSSIEKILVNVGSVDIAEGKELIDMMADYFKLLQTCKLKNIKPILTTLVPMINGLHLGNRREVFLGFNEFLRKCTKTVVIDLYISLILPSGVSDRNLFQPVARRTSGTNRAFVLLNIAGRRAVYNSLKRNLGFALIYEARFIGA